MSYPPKVVGYGREAGIDAVPLADVAVERPGAVADVRCSGFGGLEIDVGDGDANPVARQLRANGKADAFGTTRDDCRFALKTRYHCDPN